MDLIRTDLNSPQLDDLVSTVDFHSKENLLFARSIHTEKKDTFCPLGFPPVFHVFSHCHYPAGLQDETVGTPRGPRAGQRVDD